MQHLLTTLATATFFQIFFVNSSNCAVLINNIIRFSPNAEEMVVVKSSRTGKILGNKILLVLQVFCGIIYL